MSQTEPNTPPPSWFHHAPFGLLIINDDGRITQANPAMESLVGLPVSQLLGHSRESLPSPAHRALFADTGAVHLNGPGAPERWLHCETVRGPGSTIRYFIDITRERALEAENRELQERVETTRVNDVLTGLPNRRAISQHLDLHVSRSRRYGNPLSVALVRMRLDLANASLLREAHDPVLLAVSRYLRDRLRWVDQIARWDEDAFLVILPETEAADARSLLDVIAGEIDQLPLPKIFRHADLDLAVGVVGWQKGDDARTLIQRSEHLTRPAMASSA